MLELINYILENTFVLFAGHIFQQVCGIPMGGNASPQIATLTLSSMEYQFMQCRDNLDVRFSLQHVNRYVDDLLAVNCEGFLDICRRIYPVSIPLSDTSITDVACNYLDLGLRIEDSRLRVNVYNKTDDFDFKVVRYVDSSGNVPHSLGLCVFYSQCVRMARICNFSDAFARALGALTCDFIAKGFSIKELLSSFCKFYSHYSVLLSKFDISCNKKAHRFFTASHNQCLSYA